MRGLLLLVAAAILVVGVAIVGRAVQSPGSTAQPGPSSAITACNLPNSDVKTGAVDISWQVAVRLDSPMETAMLFTSGSLRLQCEASRGPDGTFWSTTTSGGSFLPQNGAALTYEGGGRTSAGDTYPNQLVIGQVPLGTASVDVLTSDGEHHSAAIGNGWYMAWATTTGQSDRVVEIDALDSAGKIIANMGDPSGLRAGTTEEPFSS